MGIIESYKPTAYTSQSVLQAPYWADSSEDMSVYLQSAYMISDAAYSYSMKARGDVYNKLDDKIDPPYDRTSHTGFYEIHDELPR